MPKSTPFTLSILTAAATTFLCEPAAAAPLLSNGISIAGVIAHQDSDNPSQFFYIPTATRPGLGDRITNFRATSFGVGERPFFVINAQGVITSRIGGILSGTVAVDISQQQRADLIAEIQRTRGIQNPSLLPISITDVKVTDLVLGGLSGSGDETTNTLPTSLQFGPEVGYSIGSENNLFATLVSQQDPRGIGMASNPHFQLNVQAKAEFVGDPWRASIRCDLSQVWRHVRRKVGVGISLGFIEIGSAEAGKVLSELNSTGACEIDNEEGSLDLQEHGVQVLEAAKTIFEEINRQALAGEGFFKFEPNPEIPPEPRGGIGLFGWKIKINAAYTEQIFKQSRIFETTLSYTGRLQRDIPFAVVLAVTCNADTRHLFQDLGDVNEPCITQPKLDGLAVRLANERQARNERILAATERFILGEITEQQLQQLIAFFSTFSFTEIISPAGPEGLTIEAATAPDEAMSTGRRAEAFVGGLTDREIEQLEEKLLSEP